MDDDSRVLGRIEGKLDGVLDEQRQQRDATIALATKVNIIESKVDRMLGWAAGAGAAMGVAGAWLKAKITGQ